MRVDRGSNLQGSYLLLNFCSDCYIVLVMVVKEHRLCRLYIERDDLASFDDLYHRLPIKTSYRHLIEDIEISLSQVPNHK